MSFKILYQEAPQPFSNLSNIAVYVDSFAKGLGLNELQIGLGNFTAVAVALARPDFPHVDGVEKASPFKKAANFFCWFVAEKPILEELSEELIGKELKEIPNHQNVIFAYHMAVDCLHKAILHRKDGDIILENKIKVSQHFFKDFVEAFSCATPKANFHVASLLFEQLAYKANPDASYPEVI